MKKRSGVLSASARSRSPGSRPRCSHCALGTSCARSVCAELQPQPHGLRRRVAGQPTEERDGFASVPQQSLVDRPPPHAAGRRRVERIEHAAARLPTHERQRRPPERQVPGCAPRGPMKHSRHQGETRGRIVAHGHNLCLGPSERACLLAHTGEVIAGWRHFRAPVQCEREPSRPRGAIGCEPVPNRRETKRRLASGTAKYVVNPVVRGLFRLGLPAPGTAILETTGRKSGRPRRNPVTNGLDDGVFWIVAEHGRRASYVRNIEANPHVRLRIGRRWRKGTARLVPDDDPRERLRYIASRRPIARLSTATVGLMQTDLLTIRIQLNGEELRRGDRGPLNPRSLHRRKR